MPSSKLDLALSLIAAEEKKAALIFTAAQNDYASAEYSLKQALSYRAEYEEMSRGLRPSKFALLNLRVARSFLAEIDGLIENQRNLLATKNMALVERREHWQLLRARRKSIEAVITSRTKLSLLAEEKKEQSRLDDIFGRSLRR